MRGPPRHSPLLFRFRAFDGSWPRAGSTACVLSGFSDWNLRLEVSDFIPWRRWPPKPAVGGAGPQLSLSRLAEIKSS